MRRYSIERADLDADKDDVLAVLMRNLKDITEERYVWSYTESPHGAARCWLAVETESDRCVGCSALFPRRIFVNGKPVYGAIAGDFAVDEAHRVYGPALRLQRTVRSVLGENGLEFIYGLPNRLSEQIFLRIGYSRIAPYSRYVKILRAEYKLGRYIPPAMLTRVFSRVIDLGFKGFSREAVYRRPEGFSVEMPDLFDERFDLLWKKVCGQFSIIGERDSRALNWRFGKSPIHDYRVFALVDGGGNIGGYIIYHLEDNVCYVADVLFVDSEPVKDSLFAEFILFMRRLGVGSISIRYLGGELLRRQLRRFGFFLVSEEDGNLLLYCDESSPLNGCLLSPENWYFLDGDTDI
ncbi:MAG: GNAT family N-acetyltransferase [Nitrospirae bacterium]|nr:GNAT family N-acetyltransferase [Nitrospirota bacterium]